MRIVMLSMACSLLYFASFAHGHGSPHAGHQASTATVAVGAEQHPFGKAAQSSDATRTIHIDMDDNMRFSPSEISVNEGDVVKFIVTNRGKILHEMVIGTQKELMQHAALMRKFPDMEHEAAYMAHVDPAKQETLVWDFNRVGEFEFACLLPGHFEAGMVGKIIVNPANRQGTK